MSDWLYPVLATGSSIVLGLIGAVWWMLHKEIALRDRYHQEQIKTIREAADDRMLILREDFDRRINQLDEEVKSVRKRLHDLVDRFSAVETGVKYGVFKKALQDDH